SANCGRFSRSPSRIVVTSAGPRQAEVEPSVLGELRRLRRQVAEDEPHEVVAPGVLQGGIEPALEPDRRSRLAAEVFAAGGGAEVCRIYLEMIGQRHEPAVEA